MATMVTQRMMNNLSYMLLAKDEFHANVQACGATPTTNDTQAQVESELARENTLLRQQLLEASADNDAISKSLQERAQSLADMTDAKIQAETEAKVLQVQLKSMQKDIDAHKYELHLLRKQIHIRNEEREHHKKASEASYKQHLENVKKIARLESECQRLRGLIRQRLPGPAAIAQMRAECDIHVKMGIKKSSPSVLPITTSSKNLHNSSLAQAHREIEGLKERLFSVEDEAKFLKEAMMKRTTELQEARQLCARTAMKLSAAEALVESMSTTDAAYSMPSTPILYPHESRVPFFNSTDHLQAFPNQEMTMLKSGGLTGDNNRVYASSIVREDVGNGIIDVNSELENDGHITISNVDEVKCAESWASALFAELSHLSNLHENTLGVANSVANCKQVMDETSEYKANVQKLDIHAAMEIVNQRLSSVGHSILTSGLATEEHANSLNTKEDINTSTNSCVTWRNDTNSMTHSADNTDILEEILQIKGLLLDIDRAMGMMGKLESADQSSKYSSGYDNVAYDERLNVNQDVHEGLSRERCLSRLRNNSLEHGNESSAGGTKFSEESNDVEDMGAKLCSEQITDEMQDMGAKLNEELDELEDMGAKLLEGLDELDDMGIELSEKTDEMQNLYKQFKEETDEMQEMGTEISGQTDVMEDGDCNTAATAILRGQLNNTTAASGPLNVAAGGQLNLACQTADRQVARERSDMAADLEGKLLAAQAELDLARGRIGELEAELARSLQDKADVADELSDTKSLNQSLQAELAGALTSVEALQLQLSALQIDQASHGIINGSPFKFRPPTLVPLDVQANMNEEQELAVARAQLADCQRSIHVIREQMGNKLQHEALQDVISIDHIQFDTSSESSKSAEQSSQLPSPITQITQNISCFATSPSTNVTVKTIEDALRQQECKILHFPTSSRSQNLHKGNSLEQVILKDGNCLEEKHSVKECKDLELDNKSQQFAYISRTSSRDRVTKSTQQLSNLPKAFTTSRIIEFFGGRAKLSKQGVRCDHESNMPFGKMFK